MNNKEIHHSLKEWKNILMSNGSSFLQYLGHSKNLTIVDASWSFETMIVTYRINPCTNVRDSVDMEEWLKFLETL